MKIDNKGIILLAAAFIAVCGLAYQAGYMQAASGLNTGGGPNISSTALNFISPSATPFSQQVNSTYIEYSGAYWNGSSSSVLGFRQFSDVFICPPDTKNNGALMIQYNNGGNYGMAGLVTVDLGNANAHGEVALGQDALSKWVPGTYLGDTAIGYQALMNAVGTGTGDSSTAVGFQAAFNQTTGTDNDAFGVYSLHENMVGRYNSGFGELALYWQKGNYNSGFGYSAVYGRPSSTGDSNTGVGYQSLDLTAGSFNTAIGANTLFNDISGSSNIAIGYGAGYYDTGSNHFWVCNQPFTSLSAEQANCLMYGTMGDSPADSTLQLNTLVSLGSGATIPSTPLAGETTSSLPTAIDYYTCGPLNGVFTLASQQAGACSSSTVSGTYQNQIIAQKSSVKDLYVGVATAPGSNANFVFTLVDGTTAEPLTCTISGSATRCADTSHSFTANAGDLLMMQVQCTGSAASCASNGASTWSVETSPEG